MPLSHNAMRLISGVAMTLLSMRGRTSPCQLTVDGRDPQAGGRAGGEVKVLKSVTACHTSLEAELAATREHLRHAKADNAALHRRLVDERNGHQIQLESAVCFWKDRADKARQQKTGGDEPWPPGSARFVAAAEATAATGQSHDLRLWQQQQRTPKQPRWLPGSTRQ